MAMSKVGIDLPKSITKLAISFYTDTLPEPPKVLMVSGNEYASIDGPKGTPIPAKWVKKIG